MKKTITRLMALMLVSLLLAAYPAMAAADPFHNSEPASSLTVRVGYSGGSFTTAKVFKDSDFAGAEQQGYSFMDSLPTPVMDAATGVPLKKLLSKADIDLDDVDSFKFYATDVPDKPYKTITKSFLYSPRYYYPKIMQYWNSDTQTFTDENGNDTTAKAIYDAVQVEPMICISDNWVRGAMKPDFSKQDSSAKYRLVLGQPKGDPVTITAPYSAKWVYQIDVVLKGTAAKSDSGNSSSAQAGETNGLSSPTTQGAADALNDIAGHWAENNIRKLVALGSISGYPNGSFKPDKFITRAEFAATLVKVFKLSSPQTGGKVFTDTAGHWARDYIATAAANGIVSGYDADTFNPDELITREQMATMLVKAAKLTPAAEGPRFADSGSISGWAREAVATATESGIMNGYSNNTLKPQGNATRAEAVTAILNAAGQKAS